MKCAAWISGWPELFLRRPGQPFFVLEEFDKVTKFNVMLQGVTELIVTGTPALRLVFRLVVVAMGIEKSLSGLMGEDLTVASLSRLPWCYSETAIWLPMERITLTARHFTLLLITL